MTYDGKEYNRLTIIGEPYLKQYGKQKCSFVDCICNCGTKLSVLLCNLKNNHTRSCGCLKEEKATIIGKSNQKHGLKTHPLYKVWIGIKERCNYNKNLRYKDYGGRGITICYEWLHDFPKFYNWCITHGWQKGLDIDRIKNDLNYCPENCRFVTRKIGNRNKRNNIVITAFNETKTLVDWSEDNRCKVGYGTLRDRIQIYKWNNEKSIITPSKRLK